MSKSILRIAAIVVLGLSTAISAQANSIAIIAITGESAPDGSGVFNTITLPSLNDAQQLGFVVLIDGSIPGANFNIAVYRGTSDSLTTIARSGQPLTGGDIIDGFPGNNTEINQSGQVMERLIVDGNGPITEEISFIGNGGPIDVFPRQGSASPSGNNELLNASVSSLTETGVAAYYGIYLGNNPERGVYRRNTDGSIETLLLRNSPAPRGGVFESVSLSSPSINNSGQVTFFTDVDPGPDFLASLVMIDGTIVHELVREGDTLSDGITTIDQISDVDNTVINNSGQIAFTAEYTQPGFGPEGVFIADTNGVRLIAGRVLEEGRGAISDPRVIGFSDSGYIGLMTDLNSVRGTSIYLVNDTDSTLIANEGDPAPQDGLFFLDIHSRSPALNENGQIAFVSDLSDQVNGDITGTALFLYDPVDGLQQVLATGDELDTSTITSLSLVGSAYSPTSRPISSNHSGLNNHGDLAFHFELADGRSGVALWSSRLPGDLNGDGFVGITDLNIILTNWNQSVPPANSTADPSGDGFVGILDLNLVLGNWNAGTPPTNYAYIPEPATTLLTLIIAPWFLLRRRND